MANYWDLAPALTAERMSEIAGLLARVRHEAIRTHEPRLGDNNWVLGCRVYGRSCNVIREVADEHDWLTIVDDTLHFVFGVGGVPVRFAHGDHEKPRPHLLRRNRDEAEAQQLAFGFGDDLVQWLWRLIVETNTETLAVDRVVLIQATSDGDVENHWILADGAVVPDNLRKNASAVKLDPPEVQLRQPRESTVTKPA